jgi:hypothetical protein
MSMQLSVHAFTTIETTTFQNTNWDFRNTPRLTDVESSHRALESLKSLLSKYALKSSFLTLPRQKNMKQIERMKKLYLHMWHEVMLCPPRLALSTSLFSVARLQKLSMITYMRKYLEFWRDCELEQDSPLSSTVKQYFCCWKWFPMALYPKQCTFQRR